MTDAILISDSGNDTFSATSPLRLQINSKVALIQNVVNFLNNNGQIVPPVHGENEKNWHCAPKLNGLVLYDFLQKEGHQIELINSYSEEKKLFLKCLENNPKVVVISTTFISNKKTLYDLVNDIRQVAPDIYIIAGGPFVLSSYLLAKRAHDNSYDTTSPREDYLFLTHEKRPHVDLYIIDKGGEQILSEAIERIKNHKSVDNLPNTAKWNGKEYIFSDFKLLDPLKIRISWKDLPVSVFNRGVVNVQASIGCPNSCQFCNFVKDKKYLSVKPLNELIWELKEISDKGIKYVRFVDDNFRLGRRDLNDVCRRFINESLDIKWMSFIRASTLQQTDINLLKESGCVETQMGIESADKSILNNMNKESDPEMYYRVISDLLEVGINCSCCFIVGFPGETKETFDKTLNFIQSIPNDSQKGLFFWSIYPFLLAPLSPIYEPENRKKYNLTGYMNKWEHSTMKSEQAYQYILDAFMQIDSASPIYSGDNMEMLMALSTNQKNRFMKARHELSKRYLNKPLDNSVAFETFRDIIYGPSGTDYQSISLKS